MVEMIEPHGGKVFDPACGSGGMFVQSAQFIEEHRKELKDGDSSVFVYGQEKTLETVNLAKMNLAVNGLRGEVMKANTYYDDPHGSFGAFDYVLANPPFNVDDVSLSSVEKDIGGGVLRANQKLKETRDKLLHRLISGKLSVENLDIQFPPGMAEEMPRAGLEG